VLGHEGSTVIVILNGLRMLAFPRPTKQAVTD
jgi:cation transport ATPase